MTEEAEKRLPFAGEFSPGQVDLLEVLKIAKKHEGDFDGMAEAVRKKYFSKAAAKRTDPTERKKQQLTRSMNVLWGMGRYGLLDRDTAELTDLGQELLAEKDDEERCRKFAGHILKNLHGIEVLRAVQALQRRGESPTKNNLARELEIRGFVLPTATTHHTTLLNWLASAGVISGAKNIDDAVVSDLAGVSLQVADEFASLTSPQRIFLRLVREMALVRGKTPVATKDIIASAKTRFGRALGRDDQIRNAVTRPLDDAGWIDLSEAGKGRGGKSGTVTATDKLINSNLELLVGTALAGIPPDLVKRLETPLEEIYTDLDSSDTYKKGVALELLALRLALDLGLHPVRFRLRSPATGGAEVDLVVDGLNLQYSRWLLQCKNTRSVSLDALAKEVGMAVLLRAHVVVLATTGRFAKSVIEYARQMMATNYLQIVLLDGAMLRRYKDAGHTELLRFFMTEAREAMQTKRAQVAGLEEEGAEVPEAELAERDQAAPPPVVRKKRARRKRKAQP